MYNQNEDKHKQPETKKKDSEGKRSEKNSSKKSSPEIVIVHRQRPPKPIPPDTISKKDGKVKDEK